MMDRDFDAPTSPSDVHIDDDDENDNDDPGAATSRDENTTPPPIKINDIDGRSRHRQVGDGTRVGM